MELAGRVALVTGGGRGLGAAVVRAFAAEGAAVVAVSRTRADVDASARRAAASGARATGAVADVRREADVERLVADVVRAHGRIDHVVSSAGAFVHAARFPRLTEAEWDEAFDTNLKAAWLVAKHAAPHMDEDGSITNVTSGLAHVQYAPGGPRMASVPYAPYSIAKAALEELTRVLAQRVRPRVNAVNPGVVRTAMSNGLGLAPEAVAPVFTWLASPAARDVRGQVVLARDWLQRHPPARRPASLAPQS